MQNNGSPGFTPSEEAAGLDYYQVWNQTLFDLIPETCKSVLEVGCASGRLGEAVKKRNGNVFYAGIEVVEAAAKIAQARLDEVHLENVERFDWSRLGGRKFDCIVFGDVLEHLIDPKRTLLDATRFLAEGGSLVCCLPNVCHWSVISGLIAGRWDYSDSGLLDRTHLRFFTLGTFRELLESCGFKVAKEERLRTGAQVPQEIVPFLQKIDVDVPAFVDRITTFQFLYRAERMPAHPVSEGASWNPGSKVARQSVAIVIPVFNKAELTRDCLASIAKHYSERGSPEVIVFDNASSDGTQAYLAEAQLEYEWLKVVRSGVNLGFAGACNKGAELADADILVFLNNDTIVLPMWLDKMLDRINDPGVGMVGSKLIYPDGRIQHAGIVFGADANPTHVHHLSHHTDAEVNRMMEYPAVTGACIMIKRGLFLEVGCMDRTYPMYYEDVDLCFKIREKGLKVIYQPESMVIHLEGRSSANEQARVSHTETSKVIFFRKWKDFMFKEFPSHAGFYQAGKDYVPR